MTQKSVKKGGKAEATAAAVKTYRRLVEAGIGFVGQWSNAIPIPNERLAVLGTAVSYVDAVLMGNAPLKVRRNAIALAIRAAYLYGKLDGKLPEPKKGTRNVSA